jgi:outer membrane protein insertion porin family
MKRAASPILRLAAALLFLAAHLLSWAGVSAARGAPRREARPQTGEQSARPGAAEDEEKRAGVSAARGAPRREARPQTGEQSARPGAAEDEEKRAGGQARPEGGKAPAPAGGQARPEGGKAPAPAGETGDATEGGEEAAEGEGDEGVGPSTMIRIGRVKLRGDLMDKKTKLDKVLRVKKGDRIEASKLLELLDAVKDHLDRLGYRVAIRESWEGETVELEIEIHPLPIVRFVYVRGNWPLFEEHILKHLKYRSGSRLPPKKERDEAFARQKKRILDYLRREGYFEGDLEMVVETTDEPHVVNLLILLRPLWQISPLWFWNPQSYRLGRLTVEGNKALSTKKIRKVFEHDLLWWERPFTLERFKKDLEKLREKYHDLGYPEVRIRHDFSPQKSLDRSRRKVDIRIVVRENIHLVLEFKGNRKISSSKLRKQVTFFKEKSADDFELRQSKISIQRHYQKKGFFQARVYAKRTKLGPKEDKITFLIRERRKFKVRSVQFRGNKAFSSSRLRKVVKTKTYPLLGVIGLGSGGFVTARQLREDAKRVARFYRKHGYRYARAWGTAVLSPKAFRHPAAVAVMEAAGEPSKKRGDIHVIFQVEEGRQVKVEKVELTCPDEKLRGRYQKAIQLEPGRPFTEGALSEDLQRIKRVSAERGHPYVKVEYEAKPSPERTGVYVTYKIDPGPVVRFGQIFIRGNLKTSRGVIARELEFDTGDRFNIKKVEESRRNLASIGIFKGARISFLGLRAKQDPVHVLVDVTERYAGYGSVELGIGASTDNLWFVSLTYTNKNLFGWGKQLEIYGEYGDRIQRSKISYKDPRFLRTELILDITGFVRNEETVRLGELLTYGLSVSVIKRFTEKLQLFMRYELKRVRRREPLRRVAAGIDESSGVDVFTNTASLGPTFIWDERDNPLAPKKGFYIATSVRWASRYLLGDLVRAADFIHFRFAGQLFIPLPFDLVFAQGARYDHGFPIGSTVVLPKTERFYAGGDTTVRGYEQDQLYTTVRGVPLPPYERPRVYRVVPQGGNIRLIYNAELQFPLWRKSILFGMPLWGAVLFDTGAITNTMADWKSVKSFFNSFKHAMGGALRLVTPVGAISVAYVVPFEPPVGTDPTGRVHFNFGFIF